jgi:hypothetical protein
MFVHLGLAIWNRQAVNLKKVAVLSIFIAFGYWLFTYTLKDYIISFLKLASD